MTHNFENELVNISEINRGLIPTNPFTPNPNAYPPSSSSVLKGGFPFEKSSDISTVNSESQTMNYDRSCKVSKFTDSEMSLNKSGSSNLVNSFNVSNLPRYGIKEQSTQTMLTARDIECLEYVNKEFLERKEEFMKTFLITHKEILRKMFEDEKMTYANTEDQKNSEKFLQKLRNSSSPIKYLNKKKINKKDKTSLDDEYPKIKKIKIHKGRKPKDRENFDLGLNGDYLVNDMSTSDLVLGKEQLVSNLFDIKEPLNVQKKIKSLNEEFNIKDMINDIKNGGNKDVYSEPSKPEPKRKFDAYHFFKEEYRLSNMHKSQEELEIDCKREWIMLDKETKKIYNINAERERKSHKQRKKFAKEQNKHKDESFNN